MHIWGEVGKLLVTLANGKWPFWFAKSVGPATTTKWEHLSSYSLEGGAAPHV